VDRPWKDAMGALWMMRDNFSFISGRQALKGADPRLFIISMV